MAAARVILSTTSLYVIDVAHCFELAAETGFDGIEVMCDQRWSTRDPDYLKRVSGWYNLPILVVHTPFSPSVPGWPSPHDQLQRIRQTLTLAEALAAETIVVHLPLKKRSLFYPWRAPFAPVKRWMRRELPAVQARTLVRIAVENLPLTWVWGRPIDPAWWNSVPEWSRVHTWLTLDTTHWATRGIDPLEAYSAAKSRICHVHLSNYDGYEHRLPYQGDLDLGALLRAMAADGFGGTISVEVHPEVLGFTDGVRLRRSLERSLSFCRTHLGQV